MRSLHVVVLIASVALCPRFAAAQDTLEIARQVGGLGAGSGAKPATAQHAPQRHLAPGLVLSPDMSDRISNLQLPTSNLLPPDQP